MNEGLDKIARAATWCHRTFGTGGLIGAVAIIVVFFVAVGAVSTSNSALRAVEDRAVEMAVEMAAERAAVLGKVVDINNLLAEWKAYENQQWRLLASQVNAAIASVPTRAAQTSVEQSMERVRQDFSGLLMRVVEVESRTTTLAEDYGRPDEELWWYRLQIALSDPKLIRVAVAPAGGYGSFTVTERIYLKDFDHLMLSDSDRAAAKYISGGLMVGHILSLPPGKYYHRANSGVMYVTESDLASITDDPVKRYYRRIEYVLTAEPDIVIRNDTSGASETLTPFNVGPNGSVISFGAAGNGFVVANLSLDKGHGWRSVNRMGVAIFRPGGGFFATGLITTTPLTMVPVPVEGYVVALRAYHNGEGFSVFKIHHVPEWW